MLVFVPSGRTGRLILASAMAMSFCLSSGPASAENDAASYGQGPVFSREARYDRVLADHVMPGQCPCFTSGAIDAWFSDLPATAVADQVICKDGPSPVITLKVGKSIATGHLLVAVRAADPTAIPYPNCVALRKKDPALAGDPPLPDRLVAEIDIERLSEAAQQACRAEVLHSSAWQELCPSKAASNLHYIDGEDLPLVNASRAFR